MRKILRGLAWAVLGLTGIGIIVGVVAAIATSPSLGLALFCIAVVWAAIIYLAYSSDEP